MIIPHQSFGNELKFLAAPPDASLIYIGTYEPAWVISSVFLSILAAYVALNAASVIEHKHDKLSKLTWIVISATTLGFGIWGMHFIGMLALRLPCGIYFDPLTTLISILPGILASGVALGVVWKQGTKRLSPYIGSIFLGAGIGAMHYTGMAAMRLEGFVRYNPTLFAVSIVVAVILSYLALRVKNDLVSLQNHGNILIAVFIGSAVSGMHYTAMSAAYFVRDNSNTIPSSVFNTDTIAILIALATVFLTLSVSTLASFSKNREVTKQLRDSEERWKFALEGSGDSVWDWNPQTDEIVFSKRWEQIVGGSENDIPNTGSDWVGTCHPDDKRLLLTAWENCIVDNQPSFTVEFRMPATDRHWIWILARGKLVSRDGEGKPLRVIGTLTDISNTKTLQAQLSQAQKLEAVGQLASGVAHEINTPIQYIGDNLSALSGDFNDIIGYICASTDAADESFKPFLNKLADQFDLDFILEDSPRAIQQARDGVERVAEIVKAMKTFAHVDSNSNKQHINLHETLNNALIISRNTYKYHAEVETDFASDVGNVPCYPNELNQVFLNLMVNAAHAIEEKKAGMGLIRITTRKLDDNVEILIQDNGAGISIENQEKVFNLFFTTKPVGKGTGQGLSLSHSIIVEKHGGKLFFESTVGAGTTFHIQLPTKFDSPKTAS
jgi:NO-binding membrane sensor protein with MHYT domain/signal transduction histidine kinase